MTYEKARESYWVAEVAIISTEGGVPIGCRFISKAKEDSIPPKTEGYVKPIGSKHNKVVFITQEEAK